MSTLALDIAGLHKSYDRPVVNDLDLKVRAGEFYALLGPNGAGKTTILRMVAGLLQPEAGSISIYGIDTNNGGMYLEGDPAAAGNQPRFIAYEAEWVRPAFQIWNLNHEYTHYLDGRLVSGNQALDAESAWEVRVAWTLLAEGVRVRPHTKGARPHRDAQSPGFAEEHEGVAVRQLRHQHDRAGHAERTGGRERPGQRGRIRHEERD